MSPAEHLSSWIETWWYIALMLRYWEAEPWQQGPPPHWSRCESGCRPDAARSAHPALPRDTACGHRRIGPVSRDRTDIRRENAGLSPMKAEIHESKRDCVLGLRSRFVVRDLLGLEGSADHSP